MNLKYFAVLALALAPMVSHAADISGSGPVSDAKERAAPGSGFTSYYPFPRLEIVKEGEGTPLQVLAQMIKDPTIQQNIQAKHFTSLQVRDLDILTHSAVWDQTGVTIPYAVSLKHAQTGAWIPLFDQGTIEILGALRVMSDGKRLTVTIVEMNDSWWLERWGRVLFGYHENIELSFANAVAKPILEGYFNADPARVEKLVKMLPNPQVLCGKCNI